MDHQGFGKTSIAVAVGKRLVREKKTGVVFVNLRGAANSHQVVAQVVSILNPRSDAADVKNFKLLLRDLVKALPVGTVIVLDNAEDAICSEVQGRLTEQEAGFDSVVNDVISSNEAIKVLVTSRVKLQPLDFRVSEHTVGSLHEKSAIDLLHSLCKVNNADHAVKIVRQCGHVPLAICIAAGIIEHEGLTSKELLQSFKELGLNAIDTDEAWLRQP